MMINRLKKIHMKTSDKKKKSLLYVEIMHYCTKNEKKHNATPPFFNPKEKKTLMGTCPTLLINCIKILFLRHFLVIFHFI
jgi:hypothetical protein